MALTVAEKHRLHKLHNLNKKSLENAIDLIKLNIKHSYKEEVSDGYYTIKQPFTDKKRIKLFENIRSYNRILFGLLVSWSDESIRRLFYEPNVFTDTQIDFLLDKNRSLEQKWTFALKIAFLKANGLVPTGNETCVRIDVNSKNFRTLSPGQIRKYNEIELFIKDFLIPSFNIRNKVQHGEWIAAFKPPDSKFFSTDLTKRIFKENIVTISARMVIFNSVYQMIVNLARFSSNNFKIDPSTTPFEYFYSHYIKKINYEQSKISSPDLNKFIDELITKNENGKRHRQDLKSYKPIVKNNLWAKILTYFRINLRKKKLYFQL